MIFVDEYFNGAMMVLKRMMKMKTTIQINMMMVILVTMMVVVMKMMGTVMKMTKMVVVMVMMLLAMPMVLSVHLTLGRRQEQPLRGCSSKHLRGGSFLPGMVKIVMMAMIYHYIYVNLYLYCVYDYDLFIGSSKHLKGGSFLPGMGW